MNDIAKRKKTLPVVIAFERASPRLRAELEERYSPPAPLPPENCDRIRDILDELRVHDAIEREIGMHRERALHELRSVRELVTSEPLRLLEALVESATGGSAAQAGATRTA